MTLFIAGYATGMIVLLAVLALLSAIKEDDRD
jgi:hypothetical protein